MAASGTTDSCGGRNTAYWRAYSGRSAAEAIGVEGMHPHELRHTAASLAIASGADVKVVQQMLGHKSATMTLDLYGHLFPDRLDEIADALDAAARSFVAPLLPRFVVVDLDVRREVSTTQEIRDLVVCLQNKTALLK